MQQSRLLSILLRLQTQGRVSARALAEAFEVSIRTIYRDIDQLSAAGVPVYAEAGRQGGFQLLDGYRTRLTGLDRPEAESLFLAGAPFAAAQLGLGPALDTMRMKLLASLPEPMRAEAEKVAQRFHADPVAWFQGAEDNALLPDLAQAVWAARQIRMQYDSWEKVVERVASPLGLVLKGGLWYLVAAVEAQPRTYRVGNILALTVLDTAAKAPAKFNLKTYWQDFARDYEARMHKDQCRVRANAAGRKRLSQFGDAYRRAILAAGDANADWLDVTLPMETVADSAAQLLGLAPDAVALGPTALVEAIQRKLQSAREAYGISRKVR